MPETTDQGGAGGGWGVKATRLCPSECSANAQSLGPTTRGTKMAKAHSAGSNGSASRLHRAQSEEARRGLTLNGKTAQPWSNEDGPASHESGLICIKRAFHALGGSSWPWG